mmetsp:Transcript_777/g.1857  ORF Transcript_777/g.1857 Transcript_777/m.1857 type:complete len:170 (+) Transcript_777:336-845(+)
MDQFHVRVLPIHPTQRTKTYLRFIILALNHDGRRFLKKMDGPQDEWYEMTFEEAYLKVRNCFRTIRSSSKRKLLQKKQSRGKVKKRSCAATTESKMPAIEDHERNDNDLESLTATTDATDCIDIIHSFKVEQDDDGWEQLLASLDLEYDIMSSQAFVADQMNEWKFEAL